MGLLALAEKPTNSYSVFGNRVDSAVTLEFF